MLFVFAPLQAVGITAFQVLGFVSALVLIGGVFFVSASHVVAAAMLTALAMAIWAAFARLTAPSSFDIYLIAGAWLTMGVVLIFVVGRKVFAPGRVNYHRIVGAILVYLSIAVTFVALFTFVGLLIPKAFSGMLFEDSPTLASNVIYFSFVTLTSTGYGDIFPVHPVARSLKLYLVSSIPRPCSRGWYHWRSKVGADNRSNCRETGVSAQIMLVRLAKWSWLKAWAMKIARHRGMKKAIVALARRLAVIMHRIWVDGGGANDPQTPLGSQPAR